MGPPVIPSLPVTKDSQVLCPLGHLNVEICTRPSGGRWVRSGGCSERNVTQGRSTSALGEVLACLT